VIFFAHEATFQSKLWVRLRKQITLRPMLEDDALTTTIDCTKEVALKKDIREIIMMTKDASPRSDGGDHPLALGWSSQVPGVVTHTPFSTW